MSAYFRFLRGETPLLAFGLGFTFFSSFGQTFLLSLFVPYFLLDFSLTNGGFGSLYAAATLTGAFLLPWAGGWLDRARLTHFTLFLIALMAASAFLMAGARGAWMLGLALVGLRLAGQGLSSHTAQTVMARYYGPGRGKALSISALGFPLGEAVLPLTLAVTIGLVGWRTSWFLVGVVALALFAPLFLGLLRWSGVETDPRLATPRDLAPDTPGVESTAPTSWRRREVLRDGSFWLALPAALLAPFWATGFFLYQTGVAEWKGWSLPFMAAAFSAFAGTRVVLSLVSGGLVDRFSARQLFPFYPLPMALGFAALLLFDGGWAAFAFMGMLGVTVGIGGTVKPALWAELYGTRNLGAIQSMMTALMVVSTAGSPLLVGFALDAGRGLDELLIWGMGSVAVVALLALGVRRPESAPR